MNWAVFIPSFLNSTTGCQHTLQFTNKHNGNCNMAFLLSSNVG